MLSSKSLRMFSSNFGKSRAWIHTKKAKDSAENRLNRMTSVVFSGFLTIGGLSYYLAKVKRDRRMKDCQFVPIDENYKATNVKFVTYQGCVLPEEMVGSGTMDRILDFKARSGDVFVCSFPKSGTTWVQEVVNQVLIGQCSKEVRQLRDPTEVRDADSVVNCSLLLNSKEDVLETKFPYLESFYPGIKDIEKRPGGRLIKTHLPAHLLPPSVFENASKVIYIYRNPKDVVVSYYHFARMVSYINYKGSFYDFLVQFMKNNAPYTPYLPHLFGYFDAAEKHPKSVLVLSYEDMKENPVKEIEKIANFLNQSLQPDELDRISELTSFESMKSNPTTNYEHWDDLGLTNKKETSLSFMRKGEVGDHKNFLDSEFDEAFNDWMKLNCQNLNREIPNFKFSLEKEVENVKTEL